MIAPSRSQRLGDTRPAGLRNRWPIGAYLLAIACGGLVVIRPTDALGLIVALGLGFVGVTIARRVDRVGHGRLVKIFLLAFAIRVVAVYLLHYLVYVHNPGLLAGDDFQYDLQAEQIVAAWHTGAGIHESLGFGSPWAYQFLEATLLYPMSTFVLLPRLVDAFAGSMMVVFLASAAGHLFDARASRVTGTVAALLPSLILYSSLNLKDAWVLLGVAIICHEVTAIEMVHIRSVAVGLLIGLGLVAAFRAWAFLVLALGLAAGMVVSLKSGRTRTLAVLGCVLLAGGLFASLGAGSSVFSILAHSDLSTVRNATAVGGSSLTAVPDIGSGAAILSYGSSTLLLVMFGPFPWDVHGVRQLLALPEVMIWYLVLPSAWRGARRALARHPAITWPLLGGAFSLIVSIALVEANLGLIFRHRLMGFIILLVLAGGGWRSPLARRPVVAPRMA